MKSPIAALLLLLCLPWNLASAKEPPTLILIEGGRIMTMDPALGDIEEGDVLVRDGRIVAVGRNLQAGDARRVDARGQVVLPGFVDAHNHLYVTTMRGQFRNQQARGSLRQHQLDRNVTCKSGREQRIALRAEVDMASADAASAGVGDVINACVRSMALKRCQRFTLVDIHVEAVEDHPQVIAPHLTDERLAGFAGVHQGNS
jgi:cytosine/adenosine deaminase-related metal-dependent hydrolase